MYHTIATCLTRLLVIAPLTSEHHLDLFDSLRFCLEKAYVRKINVKYP